MNKFEIIRRIMEILSDAQGEEFEMFELVLYKQGEIVYDEIFPEPEPEEESEKNAKSNTNG